MKIPLKRKGDVISALQSPDRAEQPSIPYYESTVLHKYEVVPAVEIDEQLGVAVLHGGLLRREAVEVEVLGDLLRLELEVGRHVDDPRGVARRPA